MVEKRASTYPSPLAGYENLPPLPHEVSQDGKSLVNPKNDQLSKAYDEFVHPLNTGIRGGFDVHIFHFQHNAEQIKYARELYDRIRREFPELRIYKFWDRPVGPHPVAMFEVNLFTPAQFGAFVAWLAVWRGPLSALVHPNTIVPEGGSEDDEGRLDHSERAIWMGERLPLDLTIFAKP